MEQLNIEGKRSGKGFVAHKAILVSALSRALADRVVLMDLTIGLKGLLGYLKALGGSNVVKIVPSNGDASESQVNGKCLKVICGSNTSYLAGDQWIGEKTPLTLCEVRVSPSNTVMPNIGATELAESLNRVIPFTASEDTRPILQCVNFIAKEGKLQMVSADGFRLAVESLNFDDQQGQALVNANDLKGVIGALKRAKRARVSFEASGESLDGMSLVIDTELIRYKWVSVIGSYPEYQKLIPTEFNTVAHLDTVEAIKAVNSLKALSTEKAYPIDLTIADGKIVLASPNGKGQAELVADIEGQVEVRIDGQYLAQALRACGGMVDLKLTNGYSPMLFSSNGYQLVVMPMLSSKATEQSKADRETEQGETEPGETEQGETEPGETEPGETEPATEPGETEPGETEPATEPVAETKPKRNRKQAVTA